MRVLMFALFAAPLVVYASDSGACYSIQNADARSYCIARAKKEPAHCYSIQGADLRAMCLAEVRGKNR